MSSWPPFRPWPNPVGGEPPRIVGGSGPELPRAPSPGPLVVAVLGPALLALLLFLPALPVMFATAELLRRSGWRTRWLTAGAIVVLVAEAVWWRESLVLLHLSAWRELGAGLFDQAPGQVERVAAFLFARMVCEAPIGVPIGVLGAVVSAQLGERQGADAPWHPATVAATARAEVRDAKRVAALLASTDAAVGCDGPPLAVARDGTLEDWRQGEFVVVPRRMRARALAGVGRPGMGKTVLGARLVASDGGAGRRSIFLDCKGTDPRLAWELLEAWQHGAGYAPAYRMWPVTALDGWRGGPGELAQRLLAGQSWGREPWWRILASRTIRLACAAPEGPPRSSAELLDRLTAEGLKGAYRDTPELAEVERLTGQRQWDGVELRMRNYFDALAGRFDGDWSWDDGEVLFARLNTLAEPEDRAATLGFLLTDLLAWATTRKARVGDDVTVYLDELGAVSHDPAVLELATDMAERLRDVGVGVVFLGQSLESFGPPEGALRLLSACSATVVLGMDRPEPILAAVGTVRRPEQTWALDHHGPTGEARLAMAERPLVDPNDVRQAQVGECWVLAGGRFLHGQVLAARFAPWPSGPVLGAVRAAEGRLVGADTPEPSRALERRERPLVPIGEAGAPAPLPVPPRWPLIVRQLAARVTAGELAAGRELAELYGLERELAALTTGSTSAKRWWRR